MGGVRALLATRPSHERWVVLVEEGSQALTAPPGVTLYQLAPGCVCCTGQLTLRVTLARVLRLDRPDRIVLDLAPSAHRAQVDALLRGPAFAGRLSVSDAG